MANRTTVVAEFRRRAGANPPTSALSAMFLGGCVALILSSNFPLSPLAPLHFYEAGAALCAVAAPITFVLGERWGAYVVPVAVLGSIVLLAITVSSAATSDGTALSVYAFQWLAIYLAYFLPWRRALGYMALTMVALNVALVENGTHWERHARVVITASFVAIFILLARLVNRLRLQATTDQLTGLLNRGGFMDAAAANVPRTIRRGDPVTLCVIDLDDFKSVNDEVGHIGADVLLVELARSWKEVLGSTSILARFGGDEFILICCDRAPDRFGELLERMRAVSSLQWSAGYAALGDFATIDDAIGEADAMLYAAKAARKSPNEQ